MENICSESQTSDPVEDYLLDFAEESRLSRKVLMGTTTGHVIGPTYYDVIDFAFVAKRREF